MRIFLRQSLGYFGDTRPMPNGISNIICFCLINRMYRTMRLMMEVEFWFIFDLEHGHKYTLQSTWYTPTWNRYICIFGFFFVNYLWLLSESKRTSKWSIGLSMFEWKKCYVKNLWNANGHINKIILITGWMLGYHLRRIYKF